MLDVSDALGGNHRERVVNLNLGVLQLPLEPNSVENVAPDASREMGMEFLQRV